MLVRRSPVVLPLLLLCLVAAGACSKQKPQHLQVRPVPLPGASSRVLLDYLAVDRAAGRVWVPAGETGNVDVIDTATTTIRPIGGFATTQATVFGKTEQVGPTAVTIGEGVVYVGNRGDGKVCAIDARAPFVLSCFPFASAGGLTATADGIAYVGMTREVWATVGAPPIGQAPPENAIVVLDASEPATLRPKGKVPIDGEAEGYAVDDAHGVFYTNLADKNATLAIDVRTRRVASTWSPRCTGDGPRGLAVDTARRVLFVACTNGLVALDAGGDGRVLDRADTGEGVDNIDYVQSRRLVYVASAKAETLSVFRVADGGRLSLVVTAHTARGARVVVADESGRAYVADSGGGRILVFDAPQ
jgi:DNA-binding beta-propeller fold protein YncE